MDKFLNEAFIGNKKIRVTFDNKGKILRLFYPNPDYKQFVNYIDFALKIDEDILYLNSGENIYKQEYIEKTNILLTEVRNYEKEIKILITDFCPTDENIYIRNLEITNLSDKEKNISVIVNSNLVSSENAEISGYIKSDALIQYDRNYALSIFSKTDLDKTYVNNTLNKIDPDEFVVDEYIGLSNMSAISFKSFKLKPNKTQEFPVFMHLNDNLEKSLLNQLDREIIRIKKNSVKTLLNKTKNYHIRYVRKHTEHNISKYSIEIQKIYIRSLLIFPILYNYDTGGFSAAIEVDEKKEYSGRYSFSWPRDSFFAFLGYALLNYDKEIEKYYSDFLKKTQNKDGSWEQRFYTDGTLAPCWGYQIDETALVVVGIYYYFSIIKNIEFLENNFNLYEKAIKFLISYTEKILKGEKTKTYDIWETHIGENIYSLGSVFAGLEAALKIFRKLEDGEFKNKLKLERIKKYKENIEEMLPKLKRHIYIKFFDEEISSFIRGEQDNSVDISSLYLSNFFNVFTPKEQKITKTVKNIDLRLRTYTGGYLRFEKDNYLEGKNPWPMGSLNMALHYIKLNDKEKALENFNFVVNTASDLGFLAEQVGENMKPVWVIGLSWMHGLFIYVLDLLNQKGWI